MFKLILNFQSNRGSVDIPFHLHLPIPLPKDDEIGFTVKDKFGNDKNKTHVSAKQ